MTDRRTQSTRQQITDLLARASRLAYQLADQPDGLERFLAKYPQMPSTSGWGRHRIFKWSREAAVDYFEQFNMEKSHH